MFDKIFKIVILFIIGFMAYTFYLYVLNTRYYSIKGFVVLDRKTGQIYMVKAIRSRPSGVLFDYKLKTREASDSLDVEIEKFLDGKPSTLGRQPPK